MTSTFVHGEVSPIRSSCNNSQLTALQQLVSDFEEEKEQEETKWPSVPVIPQDEIMDFLTDHDARNSYHSSSPPSPRSLSSRRYAGMSSPALDTSPLLQYSQVSYGEFLSPIYDEGGEEARIICNNEENKNSNSIWVKISEYLFDIFTVFVFTADVTLDILITIQFFQLREWTFFYTSLALFFCSQVAYSTLFVMIFAGGSSRRRHYFAFVCIFPFAQFVPYIVFAHSFHWPWMDKCIQKLGLDLSPTNQFDPEKDPLKQFVQAKIHQHGGFMAEALVEALPQSILQVIALVVLNDVTSFLAISSVVMSMISLASRGIILSYSLNVWTRLFNIWGFVLDVFSLFTTVLWLFFTVQGQMVTPVWPGLWEQEVSVVSAWWLYKEVVLVALWFLVGLGVFGYLAYCIWDTDFQGLCLVFGLGVVMFVPAMVVLEGSRFWLLAIFLSGSEESLMSHNHKLFKWVFTFLHTPQKAGPLNIDPGFMEKHRLINRTILKRKLTMDDSYLRMRELTANASAYSYSAIRSAHNVSGHTKKFFTSILQRGSDSRRASNLEPQIFVVGRYLFMFIVMPLTLLSSLLSLAYPIIAFFTTPFQSIPLLQLVMSFAFFGLLLVWALFGIKAFQFLWMRAHLFDMQLLNSLDWKFQNDLLQSLKDLQGIKMVKEELPLPDVLSSIVIEYGYESD